MTEIRPYLFCLCGTSSSSAHGRAALFVGREIPCAPLEEVMRGEKTIIL